MIPYLIGCSLGCCWGIGLICGIILMMAYIPYKITVQHHTTYDEALNLMNYLITGKDL